MPGNAHVVNAQRFTVLPVKKRCSIREFVQSNGITFAPGKGKSLLISTMYLHVKQTRAVKSKNHGHKPSRRIVAKMP